ncbi:Uncharacterised protein [Serratia marcescens]|nr:Uncharacterised protein [Serratia marcescens]CUY21799.1 Uncharacterised protein [Serratia marcescens]CUY55552.1 Uncharacterised protein [Serratia marcescens]CUZ39272.1 Uncharacterised protein [Serratia marcescens]CVA83730.1 Uncharacterised protein [Serratia marcescens]
MAGAPERAVAEAVRMKGCAWAGCALLLVWASGSQASLNSARPDSALGKRGEATCNMQVVEHADWGDITAVVQSARLCLRRGDGRQGAERAPIYVGFGLAQHGGARLTGTLAARALAEKTP